MASPGSFESPTTQQQTLSPPLKEMDGDTSLTIMITSGKENLKPL